MVGQRLLRIVSSISTRDICSKKLSYVSNKRITRLSSEVRVDKSELDDTGNEKYLNVCIRNRNPRNLEQMFLEPKPMGFELNSPNRHYWNKVVFEKNSKYLSAKIVHYSGKIIVEASSNESPIAQHLNSLISIKAAQLLGQIFARRTLECGINAVYQDRDNDKVDSSKSQAFFESFSENGVDLEERPFIFARSNIDQ